MATSKAAASFKCHICKECRGLGCIGELPGMGGVNSSRNFILNCEAWSRLPLSSSERASGVERAKLRLAPMTGGVQNAGYADERQFYFDLVSLAVKKGALLSIGDGAPDEKLLFGAEAVRSSGKKAAVFIKPYPDAKIEERFSWVQDVAEFAGVDIDSYNIVTMRKVAHLEKKSAAQLARLKCFFNSKGVPFAVKGVFTHSDISAMAEVKPDVIYISNHGGRVETREGSTAEFLASYADTLRPLCGELWVDGGIRSTGDVEKASSYGVAEVLVGRPFITALCARSLGGSDAVASLFR